MADHEVRYYWWNLGDIWDLFLNAFRRFLSGEWGQTQLRFYPKHPDYEDEPRLILWDTVRDRPVGSYNHTHTCPPDCN